MRRMNILILAAGQAADSIDEKYPLCLTELNGTPLIEHLVKSCQNIGPVNFAVALREQDIARYHLDNIVALLAPGAQVIRIPKQTQGAACSALLAAGIIDNEQELLIISGNELLDVDFGTVMADFRLRKLDAGTITFSSVHPRYSYVRLDEETQLVIEAAEKKPISRMATASFYWFAEGRRFVRAAKNMIRKDARVNDVFYICPTLNELVLEQARIGICPIDGSQYHPLKTEQQLIQYDAAISQRRFQ
jgi:NDP-sugar pyrophosphorylase family protein